MTARDSKKRTTQEIRVVAAVIERQGSYLVCQRPFEKRHGGLWEFPGGKLLDGEGVKEAASRELHEELGVDVVTVGEPIFSLQDPGSPFLVMFCPVLAAMMSMRSWIAASIMFIRKTFRYGENPFRLGTHLNAWP